MGTMHAGAAAICDPSNFQIFLRQKKCCAVFSDAADLAAAGITDVVTDALVYAMSSLSSSVVAASHCVNKPSSSSSTKGLPR